MGSTALTRQRVGDLQDVVSTNILIGDYIMYVKSTLNYSNETVKYYTNVLRVFNNWLECELTDLTLMGVDEFFLTRPLMQSSKNTERSILRSFFRYVDRYREMRLRFDYSMVRNGKTEEAKIKFFETNQVKDIVSKIKNEQDKLMMYTLFATGMRIGEIVRFTVDDLKDGEITIKGKGGKRRVIPIQSDLNIALHQYVLVHNIRAGCVFRHQVGKRTLANQNYSVSGLRKRLQRITESQGVVMNPHMMRHSIATALLRNGMDIRSVQTFLGHEHISTTMRYTHITNQHLRESYIRSYPQGISINVVDNLV